MTPMTGLTPRESDRSSLSFDFIVVMFYPPAPDRAAFVSADSPAIATAGFDYAGAILRVKSDST